MPANVDHGYIVKKPILSEKSTFAMNEHKRYTFLVDPRATKDEIKAAIQAIYKVRVTGVNTQVRKNKTKRLKFGAVTPAPTKKASISVHPDDTIELF